MIFYNYKIIINLIFIFFLINCKNFYYNNSYANCRKKIHNVDYSKMSCIPAGNFIMGYNGLSKEEDTGKDIQDTYPEHVVYLDSYWIDKYEVTYSEYQECVHNGFCFPAKPNYAGFSNPDQPMLGVSWYDADRYCKWKNKRLPTEAEWEKAARGEKGEIFPWGSSSINCNLAIIKENNKKGCGKETTWNVGSRGPYRYDIYDMAGNSWEWVNDWYSENYEKCGEDCFKKNPKGPCNGKDACPGYRLKVVRGGSWWWEGEYATGYNRRAHFPENKPFHHFGFRCALDG